MNYARTLTQIVLLAIVISNCLQAQSLASPFVQNPEKTESGSMVPPKWGLKTNLLYDATATINLGVEFRTGRRTSLDISGNLNPWTFKNDRKWKHIMAQPEFRWWTREAFDGSFFGLHGHYAFYNVGHLPRPFSEYMQAHRFEGWLAGAGVSYGYRWNFSHRWALEATIGVGYAYLSYDKFECGDCGRKLGEETKHWFGPTKAGITLIYGIGGQKAQKREFVPVYVPQPLPAYEPDLIVGFITPETEAVKARSESGTAYLDFVVGRWDILPDFRGNAVELRKIHSSIELVGDNSDATITGITIAGHASPEDTYDYNMALSDRRAQALKEHIRKVHGLQEGMIEAHGYGEDWKGLDSLVAISQIPDKYLLLEIIRGSEDFDIREQKLKKVSDGAPYRKVFAELYPKLRRSYYRIDYTVVPFTVERGKEVMRSRPGDLSLNEMFLIANTYEPGSKAFNNVFETAARVFPDSDTANINAAASALRCKDVSSAVRYLARVEDQNAAYWNNMGILSWLQGDKRKAAECFAKAGQKGAHNAAELEKHFRSLDR